MKELEIGDIVTFKERPGHHNGKFKIKATKILFSNKYIVLSPLDNPAKHWTKSRGTGYDLELHIDAFTYNEEHLEITKENLEAKEL